MSAILPEIKEILEKGMGTSLSDIRDIVNENFDENFLNNSEIKMFLTEIIGDDIQFCKPCAKTIFTNFFCKVIYARCYPETSID